jgi:tRNA U55 pseudouridine synthase TruB
LSIGPFSLTEAGSLAGGSAAFLAQELRGRIIPLKEAVQHLPAWEVDPETAKKIRNGRQPTLPELNAAHSGNDSAAEAVRLVCGEALVALARLDGAAGSPGEKELKILRVFQ